MNRTAFGTSSILSKAQANLPNQNPLAAATATATATQAPGATNVSITYNNFLNDKSC